VIWTQLFWTPGGGEAAPPTKPSGAKSD
jgi:hypothetical protein